MTLEARALLALAGVYDPELDEPITRLGFVESCVISDAGDVHVRLRLPTPQCAPNFAYLMAADARAALRRLPDARSVTVTLQDHYTAAEINAAVARDAGFDGAFPGETEGDLAALRALFQRKALLARQGRVCAALLAGCSPERLVTLRVADLPDIHEARRCVALRRHEDIQQQQKQDPSPVCSREPISQPVGPTERVVQQARARHVVHVDGTTRRMREAQAAVVHVPVAGDGLADGHVVLGGQAGEEQAIGNHAYRVVERELGRE